MTAATRYIRPGRATALFNGVIAGLTRAGVSVSAAGSSPCAVAPAGRCARRR